MPFVTAGDPDLDFTARADPPAGRPRLRAVRIGIPYSDPVADGPVIQASYTRALDRKIKLDADFRHAPRPGAAAGRAAGRHGQLRDRVSSRVGRFRVGGEGGGALRGHRPRSAPGRGRPAGRNLPPRGFQPDPTDRADHAARTGRAHRRAFDRLPLLCLGDGHHRRAGRVAARACRQRGLAPPADAAADLHRFRHQPCRSTCGRWRRWPTG